MNYYTMTPVSATDLSNVQIQMNGNIHLPQNITAVQEIVNGSSGALYSNGKYWFSLVGSNIDYIGSSNVKHGWVYSYGQAWWDANPPKGTGIESRPHLLHIGSLGEDQAVFANVTNIHFADVTAINALYGARFKSWIGGQGLAKNITWSNMRMYNVTFPVFVTQTYSNQGSSQTQLVNGAVTGRVNNASVMMEDFTWSGFTGQPTPTSPEMDLAYPSHVECNTNSSCKGFQTKDIHIIPQSVSPATVICMNATAALNPKLGFPFLFGSVFFQSPILLSSSIIYSNPSLAAIMIPYQVLFSQQQPRPRFCIFRPGGVIAPLIPLDELPAWVNICLTPNMVFGMQPASLSYIPREGEYDVICHHCSSSVDSLHQSVSERNGDSQSRSSPSSTSQTKRCPGAFFTEIPDGDVHTESKGSIKLPPPAIPLTTVIQNPLMGVQLYEIVGKGSHVRSASLVFQNPMKLSNSTPSSSEESMPARPGTIHSDHASQNAPGTPATSVDESDKAPTDSKIPEEQARNKRKLMRTLYEEENCTGKRPDSPYPFGSRDDSITSVASTISLVQAVELLKTRNEEALKSQRGPQKAKKSFNPSAYSNSKRKPRRVRSKARRNVRFEHRAAKKDKCSDAAHDHKQGKPEVVNSATKRRDRRREPFEENMREKSPRVSTGT
ncbi:exopolygalacturonase C [Penicillium chermesinum]|nr:exopolygalacturonase C [Penicillium chermesinum]